LGETKVNGKRVVEHLEIRPEFSYWWMTLLVEKSNWAKSPQIVDIVKLITLEHWLKINKYKKVQFITANSNLAIAASLLAKKLSIEFEWKKIPNIKNNYSLVRRVFNALPNIVQSPIWLLHYLLINWPLKGVGVKEWRSTTSTTTFISYLFNLVPEAAKQGQYESRYWTALINQLNNDQLHTNWLHIYVKDELLPSAKKARALIQQFNHTQNGNQTHVTLASFITMSLVFSTLQDWYKILKLNKLISKQLKIESGYLWPLFKKDYQDSISGISAISNLLYLNLFDKAMSDLPTQNRGCYLQENQGWEFGFLSAWQSAGHGNNIVGFPHSTVRYWDLRYFFDPRSYERKNHYNLPIPDFIGVNGDVTKKMYLDGGYPKNNLIELEALRYLHLSSPTIHKTTIENSTLKKKTILVVGGYLKEGTDNQLKLLSSVFPDIDKSFNCIVKPHPACSVNIEDFPKLRGEVSKKPIEELLLMSDVVYAGAVTSAAVDAYCVGLPVITLVDGKTLNLSPLRGFKGVYFISNAKELLSAINCARVAKIEQGKGYFYLNTGLYKWREWLNGGHDKS
jgi:surface carbohydrate biosynthesis protein (TIGR04326 family)